MALRSLTQQPTDAASCLIRPGRRAVSFAAQNHRARPITDK